MGISLMKKRREELGLSFRELAEKCPGVSVASLHRMEVDGRIPTSSFQLALVAKALGIDIKDLLWSFYEQKQS